jgi:hypothetical protein
MINRKKSKKKDFKSKLRRVALRKVLKFIVKGLSEEQRTEIANQSRWFVKKYYRKVYRSNPDTWKYYSGFEWLGYGIKKVSNVRLGRPIGAFRSGTLTRRNLYDLALLVGIEDSEIKDIDRTAMWQQIVEYVEKNEDSQINRLRRLFDGLVPMISKSDIVSLMKYAPKRWTSRDCYNDPEWRKTNLSTIFEASYLVRQIVNLKLGGKAELPVVHGLSKSVLLRIANDLKKLNLPKSTTKEEVWNKVLEKIEQDKKLQ